jgi:BirA family biotin operon repressor/biotin-[acetyl-CoA-carboxylase] ligase
MEDRELDRWHGQPIEAWQERWGVPVLRVFERVGSTNDVAADMARAGTAAGALVLADAQTRGRGRRGRTWIAPRGDSLSMSMVLRPGLDRARLLTLRLGLAAAQALEGLEDVEIGLKWPNDLMFEGRKLGGILCEAETGEHGLEHVIAGMGFNVMEPEEGWPAAIRDRATSLEAAGIQVGVPHLVAVLIDGWRQAAAVSGPLSSAERAAFHQRDTLRGRRVEVEGRPAGTAGGISPDGALLIETDNGVREVVAGTVRIQALQEQDL